MLKNDRKIFNQQDSKDFLLAEYQECFAQIRHYYSIEVNFVKFSFSGYVALIAASFALNQYLKDNPIAELYVGSVFLVGSILGLIHLAFIVRNRAYFVIVARQVNSIRKYFLERSQMDFIKYNKCYLNPQKPNYFNLRSAHTYLMLLLIIFNSILLFAALLFLLKYIRSNQIHWSHFVLSTLAFISLVVLQYTASIKYLRIRDKKPADEAIF